MKLHFNIFITFSSIMINLKNESSLITKIQVGFIISFLLFDATLKTSKK